MYYIISNDERIGSGFDTLEEAEEVKNKYMEEDYRDNVLAEYTIEFINE